MKPMPTVELSYGSLHQIALGPLKAAMMNCAMELELFDQLDQPRRAGDVARALGLNPDNTGRLLDALATIDLLQKKDGAYRNTDIARAFLVSNAPTSVAALLRQTQHAGLNPLDQLEQLVRHGPAGGGMDLADEKIWTEEVRSSAGWVFGGVGQMVAGIIGDLPGFSGFETMLDMGCGHGVFSLYILERNPGLRGVLLDRAPVLDAAAEFIEAYQAAERVTFRPGDYLADDLGQGYDLILASATLNFAIGNLPPLLGKILGALKPGGYFVSFQDGMTAERAKPDTMLGAVIPSMMMGFDYCFTQGMIAEAALDSGFRQVRSRTIATPIGEMDLDICRKAF